MRSIAKFKLVLIVLAIVFISSCGTTYSLIVDENNPPERNAVILFESLSDTGWFSITGWNGINIEEELYGYRRQYRLEQGRGFGDGKKTVLTIPAGNNRIRFDMQITHGDIRNDEREYYMSRDIEILYDFEPGKRYRIKGRVIQSRGLFIRRTELFVELFDTATNELLKIWEVPITPL